MDGAPGMMQGECMEDRVEMWKTARRIVTASAVIGGLWLLVVSPLERMVGGTKTSIERGLKEVLAAITSRETRIVEGRAEITETKEIAELSLLELKMSTTRTVEKSAAFSGVPLGTKKQIVRGIYKVKAGYKLQDGISLRMENGQPVARFPRPEILSVELLDHQALTEDDGWFNRIQPADREQILRELRQQMHKEAEESGLLGTVEATMRTRLRDLLGAESVAMEPVLP